jgi:hypothetical protein
VTGGLASAFAGNAGVSEGRLSPVESVEMDDTQSSASAARSRPHSHASCTLGDRAANVSLPRRSGRRRRAGARSCVGRHPSARLDRLGTAAQVWRSERPERLPAHACWSSVPTACVGTLITLAFVCKERRDPAAFSGAGGGPQLRLAMCYIASGSLRKRIAWMCSSSVRVDDLVALGEQQGHVVLGLTVLVNSDLAAGALVGA